ncbi:MAG TPA: hypothetical protein VM140_02450 [Burkholderiales bacterium]|nr:hypothetical protein [Burkholderiales bacterium]
MRFFCLAALLLVSAGAHAVYDANSITLGTTEAELKKKFPSANCKKLEWESRAADRRCDDSRVNFGGVEARITFYLRRDKVEAFDVRFDSRSLDTVVTFLKQRYGAPTTEQRETLGDKKPRQVYKALWEGKGERATLVGQIDARRASLLVTRGTFEEEIYKVR